jgi:hypothetical protein
MDTDQAIIDDMARAFFRAFCNRDGVSADVDSLRSLFIAEGIVVKGAAPAVETYTLAQFIEPRRALLSDGTLVDFVEEEVDSRTVVLGNLAHRLSLYRKSGVLNGVRFETTGVKTLQLVRTREGWRIVSVVWDDEREGFTPGRPGWASGQ